MRAKTPKVPEHEKAPDGLKQNSGTESNPPLLERLTNGLFPGRDLFGFSEADGTLPFLLRVNSLITDGSVVLDFGAGRGVQFESAEGLRRELLEFRRRGATVIGVDVSDELDRNPTLDQRFRLRDDHIIPLPDESVDIVVADWVVEHLPDPKGTLREIERVLKPGGWFCFRTPCKWHYSMIVAQMIPDQMHAAILARVQSSRQEEDVFPKHYRMNTIRSCRRFMKSVGLEPRFIMTHEPEPSYLGFSIPTLLLGVVYKKLVDLMPLHGLRMTILGFGQKYP